MNYEYYCTKCDVKWEESQFLNDRDLPISKPCPHCEEESCVKRGVSRSSISFGGAKSNLSRAGSGWNDLLTGIKKASARSNTIRTK